MDTQSLERKLIQIIQDYYGGDYEEAQGCLDNLLEEMQQYDNDTVTTLILLKYGGSGLCSSTLSSSKLA